MPLQVQIAKSLADFSLDVSFASDSGPLAILGSSGAGKSMLLRCIAGLDRPDRGKIVLNGRTLLDTGKGIQIPARERRVGMLFQHYALFPHRTLGENIAFGIRHLPPEEQTRRVAELLGRTRIAGLDHRYPREVSGGEQQRAALARALAIEPEALLLDEPLSALDTHLRSQMEAQLQETFAAFPRPALLVTHNIEEAYRLGEQLLVLSARPGGCLRSEGGDLSLPADRGSGAAHRLQEFFAGAASFGEHGGSARLELHAAGITRGGGDSRACWDPCESH